MAHAHQSFVDECYACDLLQRVAQANAEVERLRAILHVVADCSENDDVAFGDHLCIEQVRVEVRRVSRSRDARREAGW